MKIVNIFEHSKASLYAVQFEGQDEDELTRLLNRWYDVEEIRNFFKTNQSYITNGFFGTLSINEAVEITLKDADYIDETLFSIAAKGKNDKHNTLQTIFKALNDNEFKIVEHQKTKLKGQAKKSWLRIYAIRIGPNTFVISGGGIKLTKEMKDSSDLKDELQKLELTKNYLIEIGVFDENDYEYMEI